MSSIEVWNLIQIGGVPFLLFLALLGVMRGYWIPKHVYDDLERDRDEWKAIALQNLNVASTAVDELKERRPSSRTTK